MAQAYLILTAEKVLGLVPITSMKYLDRENTPKTVKKQESDEDKQKVEQPKRKIPMKCSMCKDRITDCFRKRSYCKVCQRFYQRWRTYDKKREKAENEDKNQIKKEYIEKQRSEYKQRIDDTSSFRN